MFSTIVHLPLPAGKMVTFRTLLSDARALLSSVVRIGVLLH